MLSFILFALGVLYLIAFMIEIPIFYEGNPKTKFFIQKMGKKNYKILLLVLGVALIAAGIYFR